MNGMFEMIIAVFSAALAILCLSMDGIMAISSMRKKNAYKDLLRRKDMLCSQMVSMEPEQEFAALKQRKENTIFPSVVMKRGGFTGRGSPFLTRYTYRSIETVEKDIERITS